METGATPVLRRWPLGWQQFDRMVPDKSRFYWGKLKKDTEDRGFKQRRERLEKTRQHHCGIVPIATHIGALLAG
jgi:hypothetical protein